MYAVIALFDNHTENLIKEVWQELHERELSFYAAEVKNRIPHITLASYNSLEKERIISLMGEVYENESSVDITFKTIGSFLKSGALFLSPTVTEELLTFHSNFHVQFKTFNDNPNSLYLPDNWIPHCTIANKLSRDKLTEAYDYCLQRIETIKGEIVEIALIELLYDKNGKCIEAPVVYSKKLLGKYE
jgi:2'-5' RNA ligase